MKKAILCFIMILLLSCSNNLHKQEVVNKEVEYFKDQRVGLCFGKIESFNWDGSIWSFTCVPCDSVKNLLKQNQ